MSGQNFGKYGMKDFGEVVDVICQHDSKYDRGAYFLVRKALDHTLKQVKDRTQRKPSSHVNGRELLEGMRDFVLDQYGPMAHNLLESYGICKSEDVGHIVFNLVEYGVFGKTEKDSLNDFKDIYDFHETFTEPFLPASKKLNGQDKKESDS